MKIPPYYSIAILLMIATTSYGQFGIRIKYNNNSYDNWSKVFQNTTQDKNLQIYHSGYEAGLDYWFRLKDRRIEFLPEISYSYAQNDLSKYQGLINTAISTLNFNFHTQIYALDMEGDCDCPTFSKQGPSINKGLFFHFTPGIGYYKTSIKLDEPSFISGRNVDGLVFRAGLGIGLDVGFSDLLTVTPIVSYYFHSKQQWEGMPADEDILINESDNPGILQFTLRFGFRPDYKYGRRR
ncbi:MAG: hypothetical protein J5I52_03560 [Saprospiraceae bacterium]|nr:MAG: hypothetical protein UZ09_BCD002002519 [Bacteroidetes bacterium OLB9]MCO6463206.1 hypothetical protein [Saprospiraceae bacterium]MCZ2338984.1 hypothetical protein [Chitinophagales bacterium]